MSMLRQDPLTGRWVVIAAHRDARPNEFRSTARLERRLTTCPFCPGNERETTPEVVVLGRSPGAAANGPGWRLRGFRNLYPALVPDAPDDPVPAAGTGPLRLPSAAGRGCHEVVVYTPDHDGSPASLSLTGMTDLLIVLRDRAREFARHPSVRYISAFCNHGPEGGATLAHPHMQIIGAPAVPLLAEVKAKRCAEHHHSRGSCLMCDLIATECADGKRIVRENGNWVGWAPWASRFPWEMMFAPRRHCASLNQAGDEDLASLAAVLRPALRALFEVHGDPSLNIVIHSTALSDEGRDTEPDSYHWHLEVMPRLSRPAGFEVGTGYTINAVVPEEAAGRLREERG